MIGYTRVENFSKTSEEISNEDKKSLETITQLLQEFEEVLLDCMHQNLKQF